jgi:hypothetical protein
MPELTHQDWVNARPYYGKTLRVHRIDLNDPRTIPAISYQLRPIGAFPAHPALNVKIIGTDGKYLPLDGVMVVILGPGEVGEHT